MNVISKIFLVSLIIVKTMHSSEMPLMRLVSHQASYGSGKSAISKPVIGASVAVDRQQEIANIVLRLDALHEKVKAVRSDLDVVEKEIAALPKNDATKKPA